ncbi:hypothetical protein FRC04_006798 [Tulasnella sp. 424]|nr:hypothetical protein FRC04_006798 [Tulasnella sp. 424]KAG8960535.1 hypothetical protein FRC05_006817 [Tulasnella sp. 425]
MSTSSALEIFSTTGKFIAAFGDVPALSALKPIGSILVAICDHVTALRDNEEAAIMVAERVDQAVRVLINHTQDLDGATLGNYRVDIKNFESWVKEVSPQN